MHRRTAAGEEEAGIDAAGGVVSQKVPGLELHEPGWLVVARAVLQLCRSTLLSPWLGFRHQRPCSCAPAKWRACSRGRPAVHARGRGARSSRSLWYVAGQVRSCSSAVWQNARSMRCCLSRSRFALCLLSQVKSNCMYVQSYVCQHTYIRRWMHAATSLCHTIWNKHAHRISYRHLCHCQRPFPCRR